LFVTEKMVAEELVVAHLQLTQWMKEKYKTATDESYRDLANLNEKLKKHEAFELELKSNNALLKQINEVGSVRSRFTDLGTVSSWFTDIGTYRGPGAKI